MQLVLHKSAFIFYMYYDMTGCGIWKWGHCGLDFCTQGLIIDYFIIQLILHRPFILLPSAFIFCNVLYMYKYMVECGIWGHCYLDLYPEGLIIDLYDIFL
jgi:hypothetical protein